MVAILGVLAAVAIPNVARFINQGQNEAALTELSNVQTAVTAYAAENDGAYPTFVQVNVPQYINPVIDTTDHYYTIDADGVVTRVEGAMP